MKPTSLFTADPVGCSHVFGLICAVHMTAGLNQKPDPTVLEGIRLRLAQLILGAVVAGESDPVALKQIALREFQRPTE